MRSFKAHDSCIKKIISSEDGVYIVVLTNDCLQMWVKQNNLENYELRKVITGI